MWLDRIEKVGRLVLWLAISSACVIAPIVYIRALAAEADAKDAAKKAEAEDAKKKAADELEAKSCKTRRLSLSNMGEYLKGLAGAQGQITFTNVSPRGGVLCVYGEAKNRTTLMSTTSIPSCKEVGPYDSTVTVDMMFAGHDVSAICSNAACDFEVKDAPEATEVAFAQASPRVAAATAPAAK